MPKCLKDNTVFLSRKGQYISDKMVGEPKCESCDKVYIRKGALQNHIKNKHQGGNMPPDPEDQGILFQNMDIPDDMDEFPGPSNETMFEAAEAAEAALAEAADTDIEKLINITSDNCDNCANSTSIEKRLTLKLRALEKSKRCLYKQNKDLKNELDDCRRLLAITAKEKIVNKEKSVTNEARKAANDQEIITLTGEQEQEVKSCEYCAFKCKGATAPEVSALQVSCL